MNLNLNGLNVYKPPFHLDLMIIVTMKENISKMPDFDIPPPSPPAPPPPPPPPHTHTHFYILINVINDPMVSAEMVILNENIKQSYLFFYSNILLNSGRHQMLSKLASLLISSLRK